MDGRLQRRVTTKILSFEIKTNIGKEKGLLGGVRDKVGEDVNENKILRNNE